MTQADPKQTFETETAKMPVQPSAKAKKNLGEFAKSSPVATRRDLVELHKRWVAMFATLKEGLSEKSVKKAQADRLELCERLDEVNRSVNTMEGMMRIEMTPQFRTVLNEAFEERNIGVQPRRGAFLVKLALLVAAFAAGTIYSDETKNFAESTIAEIQNFN